MAGEVEVGSLVVGCMMRVLGDCRVGKEKNGCRAAVVKIIGAVRHWAWMLVHRAPS